MTIYDLHDFILDNYTPEALSALAEAVEAVSGLSVSPDFASVDDAETLAEVADVADIPEELCEAVAEYRRTR